MEFECLSYGRLHARTTDVADRTSEAGGARLVVAVVDSDMDRETTERLVTTDAAALLAEHGELVTLVFDDVEASPTSSAGSTMATRPGPAASTPTSMPSWAP